MKLVRTRTELADYLNGQLDAPTVEALVEEAEAVVFELERRMQKAERDRQLLGATRDRVQAVLRRTSDDRP